MEQRSAINTGSNGRTVAVSLLVLLAYFVAVNVAETQYIARYYAYHPNLGEPLYGHVYRPWDWFIWQQRYYSSARLLYGTSFVAYLLALCAGFLGYVLVVGFRTRSSRTHQG